jgi:hypothetical protein
MLCYSQQWRCTWRRNVVTDLIVLMFEGSRLYMEETRREKDWAVVELAALLTTKLAAMCNGVSDEVRLYQ